MFTCGIMKLVRAPTTSSEGNVQGVFREEHDLNFDYSTAAILISMQVLSTRGYTQWLVHVPRLASSSYLGQPKLNSGTEPWK
jgi:hypothetical protein